MKNWKPILIYLAAFAVFVLADRFLYASPVIRTLAMACMVMFAAQLVSLVLSMIKPKERKALTLLSLLSSLTHCKFGQRHDQQRDRP